jgi:G3E family GTPase
VVDAEDGARALDGRDEAREQLAAADRVMLSKLDVAPAAAVREIHARIEALAPAAERAAFPADAPGALAMASWVLERRAVRARARHDHAPHKHGQLVAVAFAQDGARPLVAAEVERVVRALGDRLVRAKGWIAAAGPRGVERIFVEKAGARVALAPAAWDAEPPRTELVLIGELDEAAVSRALWACTASA